MQAGEVLFQVVNAAQELAQLFLSGAGFRSEFGGSFFSAAGADEGDEWGDQDVEHQAGDEKE